MVTSDVTYREASQHLLALARAEFDADDLRQASEKAWGAAAQIVKAAAQVRGWDHESHRGLFVTVRRLTEETGDTQIHDLFAYPNYLHMNFYENTFGADRVSQYMEYTKEFVSRVEAILDQSPSNGR